MKSGKTISTKNSARADTGYGKNSVGGLLCAFLLACVPASFLYADMGDRKELVLIYSGQTLGELKPCGCAREEDLGGIERRMTYLRAAAYPHRLLVDVGDNFKEPTRQGKIKAQYLLKSMALMGYDAVALGDKDFVYGNAFIQEQRNIPWVASNIRLRKNALAPEMRIKTFSNGVKAVVVAVAHPALFYAAGHADDIEVLDPRKTLSRLLPRVREREKPDVVVVLTHMRRADALQLLDVAGVDVVVNGHIETENDDIDTTPVQRGGKIFLQPGAKGQKLGELRIVLSPPGTPSFENKMVRLDSSVKFDPEMVKLYEEYNDEVEALFLASRAEKKRGGGQPVYAGEQTCKTCHAGIHAVWEQSRHARAYSTLQRVNKAFDPECLVCHTVGFNQPGGFIGETDTPGLANVQCEMCHGPAWRHAQDPSAAKPEQRASQACGRCHVKGHSPKFRFGEYWPKIKH
jgi:hypothetical protein